MKRYYFAAATLLLGTSALAWTPGSEPVADSDKNMVTLASDSGKDAGLDLAYKAYEADAAKPESASWSDGEPKLINASAVAWQEPEPAVEADPDLDLAETSIDETPLDEPVATMADDMTADMAKGLEETAAPTAIASANLTTRPAAGNYPACDPGPGDDSCIQLYEPGVRVALASWNQPTGGLIDGSTATAMGGPYEPVDVSGETAMNGDGTVDVAIGETAEAETTAI